MKGWSCHSGIPLVSRQDHLILKTLQLLQCLPLLLSQVVLGTLGTSQDSTDSSPQDLCIFLLQLPRSCLHCCDCVHHRGSGGGWCKVQSLAQHIPPRCGEGTSCQVDHSSIQSLGGQLGASLAAVNKLPQFLSLLQLGAGMSLLCCCVAETGDPLVVLWQEYGLQRHLEGPDWYLHLIGN